MFYDKAMHVCHLTFIFNLICPYAFLTEPQTIGLTGDSNVK